MPPLPPRFRLHATVVVLALSDTASMAAADDAFNRYDRNRDGRVTAAELNLPAAFARYDLDGDGVITRAEFDQVSAAPARTSRAAERAPVDLGITAADLASLPADPAHPRPAELGIGRQVPDVRFTDLAGRAHRLSDWRGEAGLVVAVTSATCPLSKRYLPSLAALEPELRAQGIGLVLVNPFASEDPAEIRAQLAAHSFTAPYVHEVDRALTGALGARSTTEVFLLDATRTLVYRGALDDQYDLVRNLPAPRQPHLRRAVAALLRGEPPEMAATAAPGCDLEAVPAAATTSPVAVTYHRDVARILQQHCVSCHQPGGVAPFALESLAAVRDRCRARGIPLVHDIDDLVFDPAAIASGQIAFIDRLPADHRQRWLADVVLHRQALAESDAVVVTTPGLAMAAAAVMPRVHVLPNGLSAAMLAAADEARSGPKPSTLDGRLRVGFASGTPTHHRDFATIAPVLAKLLDGRADVAVVIVGHLDLAAVPELVPHAARIEVRPAVSLLGLHAEVARFDVNLAPLETGNQFCAAKSPIRCTTAALVAVPSVVAATAPLEAAVIDGETGLIARSAEDWMAMITRLLDDPAGRTGMGEAARIDVIARCGPDAIRDRAGRVYAAIVAGHGRPIAAHI